MVPSKKRKSGKKGGLEVRGSQEGVVSSVECEHCCAGGKMENNELATGKGLVMWKSIWVPGGRSHGGQHEEMEQQGEGPLEFQGLGDGVGSDFPGAGCMLLNPKEVATKEDSRHMYPRVNGRAEICLNVRRRGDLTKTEAQARWLPATSLASTVQSVSKQNLAEWIPAMTASFLLPRLASSGGHQVLKIVVSIC